MQDFYVTFGGLLIKYYLHIQAKHETIVRVWMNRESKLGCWCSVYTELPKFGESKLCDTVTLHYEDASHI